MKSQEYNGLEPLSSYSVLLKKPVIWYAILAILVQSGFVLPMIAFHLTLVLICVHFQGSKNVNKMLDIQNIKCTAPLEHKV